MKSRLDKLLFQRGMVSSRERGQALILAGRVLVDEQKIEKAGAAVEEDAVIRVLGEEQEFVSRGGKKLARALEYWRIDVRGKTCLDIGTSTGGFTDCLLQHGAARVIAVDTGYGQIAAQLRTDPRVHLLEKTNARYLTPEQIWPQGESADAVGLVAIDVSFISATLVLPAVLHCVRSVPGGHPFDAIVLVKPQFEAGRENVGKGGIVRDAEAQKGAVEKVTAAVRGLGGRDIEVIDSPILGAEGNHEFLLHAGFD